MLVDARSMNSVSPPTVNGNLPTVRLNPLRIVVALGVATVAMVRASPAESAESPVPGEEPRVELFVDVEAADVQVESKTFRTRCSGPCVLQLPAGYYTVITPTVSNEILVDRSAHLRIAPGSSSAKSVSLVLLITGVIVTVAAVAVPLFVCRTGETEVDAYGQRYTRSNPCRDVDDPVKVAWIAGGGAGLTLGLIGGIGLAVSGPRLTLSF